MPSITEAISAPAERSFLRPGLGSCPDGSSEAGTSSGSSVRTSTQAWRDRSHRSSRISPAAPCSARTSCARCSAVPAASAVVAYKKMPVFPAVTEISSPTRLRSRSRTASAATGFPMIGGLWTIRLTRHSASTSQGYAGWRGGTWRGHAVAPQIAFPRKRVGPVCCGTQRRNAGGVVSWNQAVTGVRVEHHRGAACRANAPGLPCAWASS